MTDQTDLQETLDQLTAAESRCHTLRGDMLDLHCENADLRQKLWMVRLLWATVGAVVATIVTATAICLL